MLALNARPSLPSVGMGRCRRIGGRGGQRGGDGHRLYSSAPHLGNSVLAPQNATVKTHVGNVLAKLGLRDRVQAVVLAYETGLVRPGGDYRPPRRPR
jgi:hypothetical protein